MSDREHNKKRAYDLSPVILDTREPLSLSSYRRICDLCMEPLKRGQERGRGGGPLKRGQETKPAGGATTYVNADKLVHMRYMPELALKLYNDKKLKSFKLVKVCKINRVGAAYYGLTFRAQEDGSEECPVFRGVVHLIGGERALFCEIKDNDEITLRPDDDDYVSSGRTCESEDCPPLRMMKRGASTVDGFDSFTMENQQSFQINGTSRADNLKGGCYRKQVEEGEVNSAQERSWSSDSVDSMSNKRKKAKIDVLFEVVGMIATSFQEFVAKEEKPSGIEIHEVVSNITGFTSTERFKAIEKLMDGNVERFRLLKALPDEEKREWVYYLINS